MGDVSGAGDLVYSVRLQSGDQVKSESTRACPGFPPRPLAARLPSLAVAAMELEKSGRCWCLARASKEGLRDEY